MPAPPARMRSASVPCGVSSTSSSPERYWRSNSLFSPTYDETIFSICLLRSRIPRPKSSTPQLLETTVSPSRPELAQRGDAVLRDAAQAEAAGEDGGAVRDVAHRRRSRSRTPCSYRRESYSKPPPPGMGLRLSVLGPRQAPGGIRRVCPGPPDCCSPYPRPRRAEPHRPRRRAAPEATRSGAATAAPSWRSPPAAPGAPAPATPPAEKGPPASTASTRSPSGRSRSGAPTTATSRAARTSTSRARTSASCPRTSPATCAGACPCCST